MAEHTPGPWFASPAIPDEEGIRPAIYTVGPYDVTEKPSPCHYEDTICEVWDGNFPGWHNAHLIAAAPKLLAGLETLVAAVDNAGPRYVPEIVWRSAEAARPIVAKARGQSEPGG